MSHPAVPLAVFIAKPVKCLFNRRTLTQANDEIGIDYFIKRLEAEGREVPEYLNQARGSSFYCVQDNQLQTRQFSGQWKPIKRPLGVIRFNEMRQTMQASNSNAVASWYDLDGIALSLIEGEPRLVDFAYDGIKADVEDLHAVGGEGANGVVQHDGAHLLPT